MCAHVLTSISEGETNFEAFVNKIGFSIHFNGLNRMTWMKVKLIIHGPIYDRQKLGNIFVRNFSPFDWENEFSIFNDSSKRPKIHYPLNVQLSSFRGKKAISLINCILHVVCIHFHSSLMKKAIQREKENRTLRSSCRAIQCSSE